jgi:hypothetical protein
MSRERDDFRAGVMSSAHGVLDNLRDLINDDTFSLDDVRAEVELLMSFVTVGRTVTNDDPYGLFMEVMDHVDPLPDNELKDLPHDDPRNTWEDAR